MKAFHQGSVRIKHWFTGSIRRKLTVFVVLVCLLLIALVWLLGVQLVEPAYNSSIRKDLAKNIGGILSVLNDAEEEGIPSTETLYEDNKVRMYQLSQQLLVRLDERLATREFSISSLCIDMSDENTQPLLIVDNLPSDCPLHESGTRFGSAQGDASELLVRLRSEVFKTGSIYHETPQQMIMGNLTDDATIAVIVSTSLDRIPQAMGIMRQVMIFVSIGLLVISMLCAFFFSKWFSEPITRLSLATKEMARGNYDVCVPPTGDDEIADLTRDFNRMANEVKHSADLQRDLIANVSHDLRTPLTLIKGYAETIRDLSGDDPKRRSEQLSVIVDETDRLSSLVGSVMELSRMSSGNEKPMPVRFNLTQLCDELTYRYDRLAEQQGYSFEFTGEQSCEIFADPALIERALHNLLGNAVNHVGADGYIGLRVFRTSKGTAKAEVSDHGPGILPEDQPHLFDRYYRSRADAGKPGTGLGLSITKAIFEAHGFDYGVHSTPGKGATFWFEAPLA